MILYARSGRVVTAHWMDLAVAGMELEPGTTLDGEAVIWRDGRLDFGAVQSRAASSVARARALAARLPAAYAAWDVLEHPTLGDVRPRPYTERRGLLLKILDPLGPPIQSVPATDDRDVAMAWYEGLQEQGVEGVVAKRGSAGYPGGRRGWVKIRHAETVDARVVGCVGPVRRPRNLALVQAGEDRVKVSARLTPVLAERVGAILAASPATGERRAGDETYTAVDSDLEVEVLAGSGRHGTLTVIRTRSI